MGRFSYIDQVLMNYIPQKSFESPSSSPKLQLRNSNADFHDVFGGPPRRSSVHEMRYSIGETRDSSTFSGEEETLSSRSRWSALGEKPVFAEDDLNLGKYSSDDFFDDIFRGDESLCSTPRMPERDPFSSNPGSKILSPPCKSEPFGDSSPPLQFSLPAKVAKGLDIPVFTSPTTRNSYSSKDGASNSAGYSSSPSDSVSKISNQLVQGHSNMRNDMSPSHQGLSNTVKSAKLNTESNRERGTGGSQGQNNNTQFHFSIYKWACKGIPLVIPLREVHISSTKGAKSETSSSSKEWGKNGSTISEPAEALQAAKIPSPIDSVLAAPRSFMTDSKNQDNSSFLIATTSDRADSSQVPEEVVPARSESELSNSLQSIIKEAPGSFNPQNAEEEIEPCFGVSDILPDRDLYGDKQKGIYASMQIEHKPNLKPLRPLFYDDSDGQGKEEMAGDKEGGIEGANLSSKNADDDKKSKKEDEKGKLGSTAVLDSPINSEDKLITNRVKRKIKEFANIFNQDAPSKSISNDETRVHSSRWKDVDTCKPEIEKSASLLKADEKEEMSRVNENKILTDALAAVNEILKRSEKLQFGTITSNHRISNTSFERTDSSLTCSGTIPESLEDVLVNIDESHCEDLQGNYLIEDLSYDQYEQTQPSKHHEEIQLSDAKIRKWSSGKEGNIRSLLSTLQYVLWPECGWKPVPLVDIIEESAVKSAYSKALLCLHPDKLQQKGAASHQKYIAEKVFEILQEAWTHFNPLGSF